MADKEISIELRLVAAFALSFVILLGSRYVLTKFAPPPPAKPPVKQAANAPASTPGAAPSTPSAPAAPPPAPAPAPAPAEGTKVGNSEQKITVENNLYRVVISTKGAVVKDWFLKGYRDEKNNSLDLVDQEAAREFGDPLSVWLPDPDLRTKLNDALYVASPASSTIQAPATLVFEYNDGRISARKEIIFHEKDYLVEIKTDVWNGGNAVAHQVSWRGGFGDVHDIGVRGDIVDVFYRDPEKIKRLNASDVKTGQATASGQFDFAGIEDRFFTAAFLPQAGPLTVTAFRQDVVVTGQQKPRPSVGMAVESLDNPQNRLRLFVGPKQTDILASVAPRLPEVIDYGWFAIVAKPLFIALRWIYNHIVSNYGWAIILLTVFINFALFPLKLKSLRSTMKMQKIQPQMKAIQDKYKQYKATDPRKAQMNQEMMELYKKHGVNPLGGCLPLLIQMPFLYGFYRVLMSSIEMRQAPWIVWWIKDLSAPEASFIKVLPLALCITQFILQRMSPSPSPDPAQQKMMMLMPVMFLFMFWSMSSGLVLYWLTGNVVGIAQQWYINQTEMQQAVEQKKLRKAGKK